MPATLTGTYSAGDRIRVRSDVTTPIPLPGYTGTIQEVIPCYGDDTVGYNIQIDGDTRTRRVWFFYQDQLQPVVARRKAAEETNE